MLHHRCELSSALKAESHVEAGHAEIDEQVTAMLAASGHANGAVAGGPWEFGERRAKHGAAGLLERSSEVMEPSRGAPIVLGSERHAVTFPGHG